jgi:hypothetical protein
MEYDVLKRLIACGYGSRRIGRELGTSHANVLYWANKYGLKTLRAQQVGSYLCACGETDPSKFYGIKTKQCRKCFNARVVARKKNAMQRLRLMMGGKCVLCGFNRIQAALEFHHVDPSQKEFEIGNIGGWGWSRLMQEVKKCILVCSNCHAGIHAGEVSVPDSVIKEICASAITMSKSPVVESQVVG